VHDQFERRHWQRIEDTGERTEELLLALGTVEVQHALDQVGVDRRLVFQEQQVDRLGYRVNPWVERHAAGVEP
jgi:hypothetical protein